jgi:Na+-driven multidrug efflux pump
MVGFKGAINPLTAILAFIVKVPFAVVFAAMYIGEDYIKMIMCIRHFVSKKWIQPVTEDGKKGLKEYLEL